jgi:hypothetical protein
MDGIWNSITKYAAQIKNCMARVRDHITFEIDRGNATLKVIVHPPVVFGIKCSITLELKYAT